MKNTFAGACSRCGEAVSEQCGELHKDRLSGRYYLTCALCALYECAGHPPVDVTALCAQVYEGTDYSPYDYQSIDAQRIARMRSALVNSQMGTGKCKHPDDLLLVNDELASFGELWARSHTAEHGDGEGFWKSPAAPLTVAAVSKDGQIQKTRVTRLYRQWVREDLVRVELSDGSVSTATQAHRYLTPEGWSNELPEGSRVCVPSVLPHGTGQLDPDLAEVLGWSVGEGCEASTTSRQFFISQNDLAVLERIERLALGAAQRAGVTGTRSRYEFCEGKTPKLVLGGAGWRSLCDEVGYPWGTRSAERRVPSGVMQAGPESVKRFLRAYFDGEASVSEKGRVVEFSTASERLAKEVSTLLRRFGVWVRIRSKLARATNSPDCPWRTYWVGTFGGPSARRFMDSIGFSYAYKQRVLEEVCLKPVNTNTEGVPASSMIAQAVRASGLPASWFGLSPQHGLSTVYLKGTQEFSRRSLGVVIECMNQVLSEERLPRTRAERSAVSVLDKSMLESVKHAAERLVKSEVHYPKVVRVDRVPYEGWVYDVEVEGVHNYVSEGVVCHNTIVACLAMRQDMGNLVVAPTGLLTNWKKEVLKWRPDLDPVTVRSKKKWKLPAPGQVIIFSYGVLPGERCKVCRKAKRKTCSHWEDQPNPLPEIGRPLLLFGDEIHYLSNPDNLRSRLWRKLKDAVKAAGGRAYGLTGTPVSNDPDELWAILEALDLAEAAFGTYENFRNLLSGWFDQPKGERHVPQGASREVVLRGLRPVRVHRLRKHVLKHLPPVIQKTITVPMSRKTLAEVDKAVKRLAATKAAWGDVQLRVIDDPMGVSKHKSPEEHARRWAIFNELVTAYEQAGTWKDTDLEDAVKGALAYKDATPPRGELFRVRRLLSMAKINVVREFVETHEAEEEPLVVFSQHLDVLEKVFADRNGWGLYTGRLTAKKKDEIFTKFQETGELRHGLALSLAGGTGLTLTRAASMLRVDLHFNPSQNAQIRDRLNRPGAEVHDSIIITDLVADHAVDKLVHQTVTEKEMLQELFEDNSASMEGIV